VLATLEVGQGDNQYLLTHLNCTLLLPLLATKQSILAVSRAVAAAGDVTKAYYACDGT